MQIVISGDRERKSEYANVLIADLTSEGRYFILPSEVLL